MDRVVCIAGKNQIAVNALDYVLQNLPVGSIVALPNPCDEGVNSWQPSFRRHAVRRSVPVVTLDELYLIRDLLFISLEFAEIVKPERFLSSSLFNIHFSLLPKYKGMYTSAWPLINGESQSGVTLHRIDAGIDTGDIISQAKFSINPVDTARDLYFKYLSAGYEIFRDNFLSLLSGDFVAKAQPFEESSYYSRNSINYSNLHVDWRKTAYEVVNQIRAYCFREFQLPLFNGSSICGATPTMNRSLLRPGCIVSEGGGSVTVATIDYDVDLKLDFYGILLDAVSDDDVGKIVDVIKFIPDLNLRNGKGWNAVIVAAFNGSLNALKLLLSRGASPCATNFKGTTALMYAFSCFERTGDSACFRLLLEAGADARALDDEGRSVLDYMSLRENMRLAHLIQR